MNCFECSVFSVQSFLVEKGERVDIGDFGRLNWRCGLFVFFQDPGIFTSAALGAVDDEAAFAEGDASQASRHDDYFFAEEDLGSESDATSFQTICDEAGMLA